MPEILTKAALAEELDVTRGRISQLIGQGMPVRPDGRIARTLAAGSWITWTPQMVITGHRLGARHASGSTYSTEGGFDVPDVNRK